MRLLLDTSVGGKVAHDLADDGHDVERVGNWPADAGDEEILARAHAERRILVTVDKDFGELTIVHRNS